MNQTTLDYLGVCERLKLVADQQYATKKFRRAMASYDVVLDSLKSLSGYSAAEVLVGQVLATKASVHVRNGNSRKALPMIRQALELPSIRADAKTRSCLLEMQVVTDLETMMHEHRHEHRHEHPGLFDNHTGACEVSDSELPPLTSSEVDRM